MTIEITLHGAIMTAPITAPDELRHACNRMRPHPFSIKREIYEDTALSLKDWIEETKAEEESNLLEALEEVIKRNRAEDPNAYPETGDKSASTLAGLAEFEIKGVSLFIVE